MEMPKNPGGKATASTLEEVGIGHTPSHRRQTMATLPGAVFEPLVTATLASGAELTSAMVYRKVKAYEQEQARQADLTNEVLRTTE